MTGEGSEYSERRRETDEDETERVVREIIDEVQKEIEEREISEAEEEVEEVKDPEECVREAIEEIRQEEEERERAQEEWEERQREREEQLEESREEREERADKDDFAELEEKILENFDDYGIGPEEVKDRWRERFEEDVKEQLDGSHDENEQEEGKDSEEHTIEDEVYYTDSNGQVHVVKTESNETSEEKVESALEDPEQQEEPAEIPDLPEHHGVEPSVEERDITPQDEHATHAKEEVLEHSQVREDIEVDEDAEKQIVESELMDDIPERTSLIEETENPDLESEPSLNSDESVENHRHQENHELQSEENGEQPGLSTEVDVEHDKCHECEHQESHEPDTSPEESSEESESREEEIWTSYEINNSSIEDEQWKRYLREIFNAISEEEKEAFKEYLREQASTMEEFEELLRKYGLEELLDEEDVMEEVRKFLEFKQALRADPERSVKKVAEELEIDVEQALEWSRGESEPLSLKKLLNLEAYYLWDQILRSYRERDYPTTREELVRILAENSELRTSRFLPIEREEALAWIEIIGMRRRGEIKRIIRNGRELYNRDQIKELSEKYGISAKEIIEWLRGERVPVLIKQSSNHLRKISTKNIPSNGETKKKQSERGGPSTKSKKIDPFDVYQLYFIDDLTMDDTAEKLGLKTTRQIRRILKDHGWNVKPHEKIDWDEVHRLHSEEGLSFGKIAKITGLTASTIRKAFKQKGWKTRNVRVRRETPDINKVYNLYNEKGLTKEEVAEELNASESSIRKIFREMGWPSKIRKFDTKAKRKAAKKESKRETARKTVALREKLFGINCKICGASKNKKTLVIHRKDGSEHDKDILWKVRFLRTVNPEEWATLCRSCHPGIHWMMDTFNLKFEDIKEFYVLNHKKKNFEEKLIYKLDTDAQVSEKYLQIKQKNLDRDADIRRLLFGETCYLCGVHYSEKTLVIHRKDGKQHAGNLIHGERNLGRLNPNEWTSLCQKCHRQVHWAMDSLLMDWKDFEVLKHKE
jgi:DNA-binding XRE family transcriptional regulator